MQNQGQQPNIAQLLAQITGQQVPTTPGYNPTTSGQSQGGVAPQQTGTNQLSSMTMPQLLAEIKNPPTGKYAKLTKSEIPAHSPQGQANEQFTNNQYPVESTAFGQAIASGADPSVLAHLSGSLNTHQFIGLCEAYVEQETQGKQGIYPSAIAAWNAQKSSAQQDMSKIKPGDVVYFAPDASNGGNGHTGIYVGNNQFVSATYDGVKQYNLNDWQQATGQKLLGYVPKGSSSPVQPQQVQNPKPQQKPMPQPQQMGRQLVPPQAQPRPAQQPQQQSILGNVGNAIKNII